MPAPKNIRRLAICSALLATAAMPTSAWAGTIIGTVSEGSATQGLQSAELRIVELDRVARSGRGGAYRFPDVPAGSYTMEARYVGADMVTTKVDVPETGNVRIDIVMQGMGRNEILVIGQAANQASALSRQRAADGVVSALTRDSVGQFPDQNVAESLRRLPGLNVLNDQGEGRFVSVRGLDPNLNSSSINGVRLPSPESDIRSVALDVISSDLIESIEVKKSLTPDMDGDTIGASIEINTVSAFDRKKDLLSVKVEGSYNDLRDVASPKASIDFSTRLSDNLGIAGGLSYYNRRFETDNVEAEDWTTTDEGFGYAEEVQYRDYDVQRERISASLSLDFRASDDTSLYIRGIYSQFDDQEFRRRNIFKLGDATVTGVDADNVSFSDAGGEIEIERDIKDRQEEQKIRSIALGGETNTGPWTIEYSASWAKSSELEDGSVDPTVFIRGFEDDGLDVLFDYSDSKIPLFNYLSGADIATDPSGYGLDEVEFTKRSDAQDEEYAAQFDIGRQFAMGSGDFTVQAGFKGRWREKSYNLDVEFYEDPTGTYNLGDVLGFPTYRITDISPLPSFRGASNFFFDNFDLFELQPDDSIFDSAAGDYVADEDILAGYLLGRWDSDTLRVIGGVRYENTKTDLNGNRVDEDGPTITPVRFSNDYDNWLPSLNIRFEPQRNLVFRAAAYRSLVRPNLADLAPRFELSDDNEGDFGNPDLRPYRAWNFDASAEYYFSNNGAISANFFYKDVKDFVVDSFNEDGGVFNGITFEEAVIPINGESATIKGVELSLSQALTFLPSPLDGFLVQVNYTYTDAEGTLDDGRDIPLPASSKHTLNAVLGYETGPFSFRLAGTYRDKYLDEIGASAEDDRIVASHFQLDASAKYRVNKNLQFFLEWVNINDEPYFAYQNRDNRRRLLQYEEYSWTAKFGAKVNF
ncbi:TonB-dependent receptor [Parasphingorhabdus sp.]|uniref:TonB-dependent receptor n=1 Tax=Parasphingorhabdus sp. TaxID=2709688 RepID=UPI003BB0CCE7